MTVTFTMNVFACCAVLFGPLYGFWGAYVCRSSRLGSLWGFLVCSFTAYAGWFISGLIAFNLYPDYPVDGPGESSAVLFTIPGFVTGLAAVLVTGRIGRKTAAVEG
jgi:hypothetical protein